MVPPADILVSPCTRPIERRDLVEVVAIEVIGLDDVRRGADVREVVTNVVGLTIALVSCEEPGPLEREDL